MFIYLIGNLRSLQKFRLVKIDHVIWTYLSILPRSVINLLNICFLWFNIHGLSLQEIQTAEYMNQNDFLSFYSSESY